MSTHDSNQSGAGDSAETSASAKGRPTRSRAQAEAERKARLNPTADKKAERAAARKRREDARQGQLRGDERFLPARDRGPVRAWIRDYVDSRFNLGEFFMPAAFVVIFVSLTGIAAVIQIAYYIFMVLFLGVVVDAVIVGFRLRAELRTRFGDQKELTKGGVLYAVMRTTQLRKLRVPLPRVQRGQKS